MGRVETGTSSGRENAFKEGGETERADRADIYHFFFLFCVCLFLIVALKKALVSSTFSALQPPQYLFPDFSNISN